jgi:hypothetical protein
MFAYYTTHPDLLPAAYREPGKSDSVFPWFIVTALPSGITGLLIASIFAAAMSTISSSLNSTATILLNDYYGRFVNREATERQKMLLVKKSNPDVDIRFVFQNANKPIYKGSPTTHADWCNKHGFQYSDKGVVPQRWLDELAASRGSHPQTS